MSAIELIYSRLSEFAGLQALIGNSDSPETFRVYARRALQDAVTPYVVYSKVGGSEPLALVNSGGNTVNYRFRIESFADTLVEATALAAQVKLAMVGATTFSAVLIFETDNDDDETQRFSVLADYSIWFT